MNKTFLWQIVSALLLLCSPLAVLLLSDSPTNPGSYPYLDALIHVDRYSTPAGYINFMGLKGALHAFFHPLDATQRFYVQWESPQLSFLYAIVVYLTVPIALSWLGFAWRRHGSWKRLYEPTGYYCAFLLTSLFIVLISKNGGMHHSILSYPFLILSFLATWKIIKNHSAELPDYFQLFLECVVIGYVSFSVLFFLLFPLQPVRAYNDPVRFLIRSITQEDAIAERYLVYVPDWGTYFYTSLFGSRKQSVVFGFFYRGDTRITTLQKLAHEQGRKLMIVYSPLQSSLNTFLSSKVVLGPCSAIPANAAWTILAEPDALLTEACTKYEWVTNGGEALSHNIFVRLRLIF